MAIFKCKICGGTLEIDGTQSVATCEYCGTKQTIPKLDDERKANLYDRANHFRRNNDFDKAMSIYEQILNEDNTDAESYWSILLCRYGIEYVEDPATHKRVPTINRAQYTSIFDDEDYKSALQYADSYQREIYEAEANAINEIQKNILAISQKEEPFDVFICYKETDVGGRRTQDSVLATELYHELTREGFKVFFSRITLEDRLGQEYEPYIFAALNSAKVMVVLGTKPEHFNAVWVKNEWSRYLALIKNGAKKTLIPAYRDMDPYDLPEEFSHLQAQDMSKLGFMQDLTRGIKKIVEASAPKATIKETVVASATAPNIAPLLKRAFMFLEDGDFDRADDFCEQVLNQDPENAQAYLGKLMAELRIKRQTDLSNCAEPFDNNKNYEKAVRFADAKLASELRGYIATIKDRNARKAEEARKETLYLKAMDDYKSYDIVRLQEAIKVFTSLAGYKDSDERIRLCQAKIDQIKIKEENDRIEREHLAEEKRIADEKARLEKQRQAEIDRIKAEKRHEARVKKAKITSIIVACVVLLIGVVVFIVYQTSPASKFEYSKNASNEIVITGIKNKNKAIKDGVLTVPNSIFGAKVIEIKDDAFDDATFQTLKFDGTVAEWNQIKKSDIFSRYDLLHNGECDFCDWFFEEGFDCTVGGKQIRLCQMCKAEDTRMISAGEHTIKTLAAVSSTCTKTGLTEGSQCSICGIIIVEPQIVEATGHTPVTDQAKEPTCTQTGLTEGSHCSVCKETLVAQTSIDALGHSYGSWQVTKEATCTQSGTQKRVCSVCNGTDTASIQAKGHSYTNRICSACGSKQPSEGLNYITSGNGYAVSGIGSCTDTEIVIPENYNGKPVVAIAENAFYDISWITNVEIPNTVTTIGRQAFKNCSSLKELHIPNSVTTIKAYAFDACNSLTKLYIGTGLSHVDEGGFHDCRNLVEVHISDIKSYAAINFELFASPFDGYLSKAKLYVNGKLAKSITIPGSTQIIGERAFDDCPTITNVVIENGVTTISDYAFANCGGLVTITIPTSVQKIGYMAFAGGMSALGNAPKLEKIIYKGTRAQWMQISKDSNWDDSNYSFIIQCTDGNIE